jgi:ribonuclease P protein component
MISQVHRFHGHGSLRYVYQNGKVVRGPLCSLKYIRNEKRKNWRLAVVVSKKVHKSAVKRNRIRRRLYEAMRLEAKDIDAYDIVITVFNEQLAEIPATEITKLIKSQLRQAGIIKKATVKSTKQTD